MAGYCTSVRSYFYELQASENTAQECNIQPYCPLTHQIIYMYMAVSVWVWPVSVGVACECVGMPSNLE